VKKLLAIGLVLLSTSAWAEWIEYVKSTDGSLTYVDPTTKTSGNRPRVWIFQRYATRMPSGEMSNKALWEADCLEGRLKGLYFIFYRDTDGKDHLSTQSGDGQWDYPSPNSVLSSLFLYLCGKSP
jgi:hypothetical protein